MNVKQLSDISGVHIETIRSYRKAGYLNPGQRENGYYDYSFADLVTLLWIRKLRGYTMSMDHIHDYFYSEDPSQLLSILEEKKRYIRNEIMAMEQASRFIELETRHIEETQAGETGARMFQSIDDKIDIYSLSNRSDRFRQLYFSMTPTIRVPMDILNGPVEDRIIPIEAGVGTYRYILDEHHFAVPSDAIIIPNGLNIVQVVIIDNFSRMNLKQLSGMMEYARANGLTFQSDTTGYLMRVTLHEGKPRYHFRIRACVEPNDIRDPSITPHRR